jgi:hypothetical protein
MSGFFSRLFRDRNAEEDWQRAEEPPEELPEYEFENESVDTRQAEEFVEEHLGVPQEPPPDDENFPHD